MAPTRKTAPPRDVDTPHGPARVDVHLPSVQAVALLALGHGAGGGVEARDLVAVRDAAVARGVAVALVTQPYRVAGRRAPAPAPQLDRAWVTAVGEATSRPGLAGLPLVAGGRSSGARVACRSAGQVGAAGVLALAFPLHPPGRPERTRVDDLTSLDVPLLVVQGEKDPFGAPGEFPPDVDVRPVQGANHGFARTTDLDAAAAKAADWVVRTAKAGRG